MFGHAQLPHLCPQGSRAVCDGRSVNSVIGFCALFGVPPLRPYYSEDLLPTAVVPNPSAARPRFRNSRAPAVRLRIRFSYRKSSTSASSSPVSMICTRSTRLSSPLAIPLTLFLTSLDQSREPQPLLCQVTESVFCECDRRTLCPLLAPGCILAVDLSSR